MATQAGIAFISVEYDPASVRRLRATTEAETRRATGTLGRVGKSAARALTFGAGIAFVAGVGKAISSAADFQKQLSVLQAVSHATGDEMKRAGDLAIQLGADVKLPATSAGDAAVAMTELAKGGLSVSQSMKAARGTLELAAAGQIAVGEAAKTTANVLNQFSISGAHAGHIADLLAGAANASSGEVTDFGTALSYTGTAAHAAGQSVDQTVGALAEMAQQGIIGSKAGTSLANAMRALQAPSAAAADAMKKFGINIYDAQGKMLPLDKVAQVFTKHMGALDDKTRNAALAQIFGTRSVLAARAVFLQGGAALDKYTRIVSKQGNAQRLARAQTRGFSGALAGLQSTLETVGIQIGLKVLPALTSVTQAVSRDLPGAVDTATRAVSNLSGPVGFLAENFGTLQPLLIGTAAAFVTLKTLSIAATAATATYGAVTSTLATAQLLLTQGTTGLAAAQRLQGSSAAIAAAQNSANTAATTAAAAAQAAYAAAMDGTITAQTASTIGAAATAAAYDAEGASAIAAAAEVGVLDAAMLATPWGLAALGVAAAVGLAAAFISLRGSTDPLKGVFDRASDAVSGMARALRDERDAAHDLIGDQIDLKNSGLALQRAQAQEKATSATLVGARRTLNDLAAKGAKGTKAYRDAETALNDARINHEQAVNDIAGAEQRLGDSRRQARQDLHKEREATRGATDSVKGYAKSLKDTLDNSRRLAISTERAGTRFVGLNTTTRQSSEVITHFAQDMRDLNEKVSGSIPKLARTAAEAEKVAAQYKGSDSAAAHAARAYARNAEAALRAARKLRTLTGVAGDLARALGQIPDQKTIDIYTTTHTADRRQRRAAGGPVTAHVPYVVGENRPELFIPQTNGFILPRVPTGSGGGGDVVISIDGQILREHIDYRVERREKRTARRVLAVGGR